MKTLTETETTLTRLESQVKDIADTITSGEYEMDKDEIEEHGGCTAYHYLQNLADIEYTLNADKTFKGASILVAFGGPNIYINTIEKRVEGYYELDKAFYNYEDNLGIEDFCHELYYC